ncbi:endolytic transglycosylase MltG [Streptomyces gamaensis]|uniref:Endolytic murein transglycosylase n=1 Tax=Streptomyces gamaensis TaxID=1763542 RepID=A0ABW0Z9P4_9ACTN
MTEYGRGPGSHPWHPGDPHYGDQGYGGQQAPQQQSQQPPYGQQQGYGWDPSQGAGGPYAGHPGQGYGHGEVTGQHGLPEQHGQQAADPYAGHADPYGTTATGYPPHQREDREQQQYQEQQAPAHGEPWPTDPGEERISLFSDAPADDALLPAPAPQEPSRRGRDRRGKKKKNKRRSGTACLLVSVVLLGAVGGVGYLGYEFYQSRFGPAPDYSGDGSGEIQVEIPKDSSLTQMGKVLLDAGVVKSVGAFTEAAGKSPRGKAIQAGVYTLRKEMSGEAVVRMMTDPKTFNALTIPEGMRAADVYAAIDKKLELAPGTTKETARSQAKNLGLPAWATADPRVKDPLEGFLFPSQYSAAKGGKPEDVLRQMVARAGQNYAEQGVEAKAGELGLQSPLQLVTVASLVQAEGKYKHDFDKVARVVYNRLKPDNKETFGLLDFDSTVNYARSQSTLNTGSVNELRKFKDPYNTYSIKGLPPGPIGNPGLEALKSAMNPAQGPWYYFVSVNENETLFAVTNEEQNKNRQRYEQEKKKAGQ